jgi:hypothetical protein
MAAAKGPRAANRTERFDYLVVGAGTAVAIRSAAFSATMTRAALMFPATTQGR